MSIKKYLINILLKSRHNFLCSLYQSKVDQLWVKFYTWHNGLFLMPASWNSWILPHAHIMYSFSHIHFIYFNVYGLKIECTGEM